MRRGPRIFCAVVSGWIVVLALPGFANQPTESSAAAAMPEGVRFTTRFDGLVTVRGAAGRTKTIHVVIRDWFIPKAHVISRFPESGPVLVELVGGSVSTIIGQQRQTRRPSEFWMVAQGTSMAIEAGVRAAALQTVAIQNE